MRHDASEKTVNVARDCLRSKHWHDDCEEWLAEAGKTLVAGGGRTAATYRNSSKRLPSFLYWGPKLVMPRYDSKTRRTRCVVHWSGMWAQRPYLSLSLPVADSDSSSIRQSVLADSIITPSMDNSSDKLFRDARQLSRKQTLDIQQSLLRWATSVPMYIVMINVFIRLHPTLLSEIEVWYDGLRIVDEEDLDFEDGYENLGPPPVLDLTQKRIVDIASKNFTYTLVNESECSYRLCLYSFIFW